MKIGLAQLDVTAAAPAENRERALDAIDRAAERGADLVALPELWNVGFFAFDAYEELAEPLDGPSLSAVRQRAAERNVGLVAGSVVEDLEATAGGPADAGLANTTVFFDRDGDSIATYRKRHLFGYESRESELLVPGESPGTAEFEGFTVGLTTCYDLRFPELYRSLLDAGVTLVVVPSAWPYPRVEHWKTLASARAIENLFYVATVNGAATFEDATLLGRSTVYDPWGTVLSSSGDEPTLVFADVDPDRVANIRGEFPALEDRRGRTGL
ncbi:MAG: carbon-nitrogen family hydrolase [Halanaeroarchaeum sp.]